jgi:hypothetical protein
MKCYKLTDENMQTWNNTKWVLGEWHEPYYRDATANLCSGAWLHGYLDPVLAVLLNPIHADFNTPRLFEAEAKGEIKYDGQLKFGCQKMRIVKELALPKIPLVKRVEFAIKLALKIYKNKDFVKWANNWLNDSDRSAESANAAYDAAWAASYADNYATSNAVNAAYAASAASCAVSAAGAAEYLASKKKLTNKNSREYVALTIERFNETKPAVNLTKIIKQLLKGIK